RTRRLWTSSPDRFPSTPRHRPLTPSPPRTIPTLFMSEYTLIDTSECSLIEWSHDRHSPQTRSRHEPPGTSGRDRERRPPPGDPARPERHHQPDRPGGRYRRGHRVPRVQRQAGTAAGLRGRRRTGGTRGRGDPPDPPRPRPADPPRP